MSKKPTPRKSKSSANSFATTNASFSTKDGSFAVEGYGNGNDYNQDDEEEMITPAKRKRVTKMEENGQSAPIFKIEGQGEERKPIDLEKD